jgi:amidohydrolase
MLKKLLDEYYDEFAQTRKYLHKNPELSLKEYNTTKYIRENLVSYGIEIVDCGLETGVIGLLNGAKPGKCMAIREDIDALPILEKTGLDYKSINPGVMHACGHDIHISVLLYVAKVLSELRDQISGKLLFIFQPAEENAAGANLIIDTKVLEKYKVENIIGLHCSPEIDLGKLGFIAGPANASIDVIKIIVEGKGGHGAHPYNAVDPVAITAYLITLLQTVITRENKPTAPAVLTFGMIHGGTSPNIIPDKVEINGTLRSLDHDYRAICKDAIERVAKNHCKAMRAKCEVEFSSPIPPLINSKEVINGVQSAVKEILSANNIHHIDSPSMGSDDFSVLLNKVGKGAQFRLGTGTDDPNSREGLHNASNIFDTRAIYYGAAAICQYALNYLKEV